MKYVVYQKRNALGAKRWRWRLVADNGRILASGEAFNTKRACLGSVDLVRWSNTALVTFA
jgi:uncharacterized protein YegP (UPF0339 family)